MRFLGRSLMGLVLLSLTVGLLAWAGDAVYSAIEARRSRTAQEPAHRERVFSVNVTPMTPGEVTPVLTVFGEVRSQRLLDLRASATGRVVMLAPGFEDGGTVQQGQLLARIDPADAQSALQRTRTDMQEAEDEVRDASSALALARDDLTLAEAQAALRSRALARQKDLQSRGVGTESTVEAAELADAAAAQAVLSRRQALQKAQERQNQADIRLQRQKIALQDAQRSLADTEIRAPFAGALEQVSVVEGGIVTLNERLARLIDAAALEVSFRVSTAQYARLLTSDGGLAPLKVQAVLDVLGVDLTAEGLLSRESGSVGQGQTGRELFARLTEAQGFRPGDFVTVRIKEPPLRDVVVLPAAALSAQNRVLVLVDGDRLEEAAVTLLRRQGNDVIVSAPDLTGREVVTERSPLLGAGIKVRPTRRTAPEAATTTPAEPETLVLDPARRARLVAFVKGSVAMPEEARKRVLAQLARARVPARVVARIESRMGG